MQEFGSLSSMCWTSSHLSLSVKNDKGIFLAATVSGQIIHQMVLTDADGIRCRAIFDTGASTSYASSSLINALGKKMLRKEAREIEMMLETKKTVLEIYGAELKSADGDFLMKTEPTKLDKPVVTEVSNPDVVGVLSTYHHLIPAITLKELRLLVSVKTNSYQYIWPLEQVITMH